MNLFELEQSDLDSAFYDPANDKINVRHVSDTRKPKLLLKHINKLKKIRALRKLENLKREHLMSVMYAEPEGDAGGGFGGPAPF